jgi:hypothetical protein
VRSIHAETPVANGRKMSVILKDYFNQDAAQEIYAQAAVKPLK